MGAPLPPDENERITELRTFDILDSLPESAYDDITKLAAFICGTPTALISLVDERRQWFKSRVGLDVNETPREHAFCAYAIHETQPMMVRDAHDDPRFRDNPLVTGDPRIRFYTGAPLRTPAGRALGTLCVIDYRPRELNAQQIEALEILGRQVTQLLELRRKSMHLEQANAEKNRYLGTAANDLRNPLRTIRNLSNHVLDEDLAADHRQIVQRVRSLSETMLNTIQNTLDLTNLDDGELHLDREAVDADRLVEDCVQLNQALARRRHVRIVPVLPGQPVLLHADAGRMEQVVDSIIHNAVKFSRPGGRVTVAVHNTEDRVAIQVTDQGPGVPEHQRERIFEPYYKTTSAAHGESGGGLGLAISRRIVREHGGEIHVGGEIGYGATFTVQLPKHSN